MPAVLEARTSTATRRVISCIQRTIEHAEAAMQPEIEHRKAELERICKELKIKRLYAFGSAATSRRYSELSDIDFLISFEDDISPEEYSENYFDLHYRLRELFDREVDVVTERSLSNPYFIKGVDESKILLYEA